MKKKVEEKENGGGDCDFIPISTIQLLSYSPSLAWQGWG